MADKVHLYKDSAGEWRWHRKSENGQVVADSGEGYTDWDQAFGMAQSVNGLTDITYVTDKGTDDG